MVWNRSFLGFSLLYIGLGIPVTSICLGEKHGFLGSWLIPGRFRVWRPIVKTLQLRSDSRKLKMKAAVELVCGVKLKGVSGRNVHSLRKPAMKRGPVTVIKYAKPEEPGVQGPVEEMLIEKGARDPNEVIADSGCFV